MKIRIRQITQSQNLKMLNRKPKRKNSIVVRIRQGYEHLMDEFFKGIAEVIDAKESPEAMVSALHNLSNSEWFEDFAENQAIQLIKDISSKSSRNWREAAKNSSKSFRIHQMLKRELQDNSFFWTAINNNAQMIKTLPGTISSNIVEFTAKNVIAGKRSGEIVKEIKEQKPGFENWKAIRIARTETSKAQEGITQTRCHAIGLDWYVWSTSRDGNRVRYSHRKMEGVACQFSNPPAPEQLFPLINKDGKPVKSNLGCYNAGCAPNCRCTAYPIIDIEDETFPLKVCLGGKVQRITKKNFLVIAGSSVIF